MKSTAKRPTINKTMLRRVRQAIDHHREQFDYFRLAAKEVSDDFASCDVDVPPTDLLHDCNTAGCIAGWTLALAGEDKLDGFVVMQRASELLGFRFCDGMFTPFLFFARAYPDLQRDMARIGLDISAFHDLGYTTQSLKECPAEEALRRLDFLIAHCDHDEERFGPEQDPPALD